MKPSQILGLTRRSVVLGMSAAAVLPTRHLTAQPANPLLTIRDPSGLVRTLDEAAFAAMPWQELRTETRWTTGVQIFRGPFLKDVLTGGGMARADLNGRSLLMRALNDFGISVPANDAWDYEPLLAREMNGQIMRVRDKGPLWLVYPRDQRPEIQNAVMDERWIWQLSEIDIL